MSPRRITRERNHGLTKKTTWFVAPSFSSSAQGPLAIGTVIAHPSKTSRILADITKHHEIDMPDIVTETEELDPRRCRQRTDPDDSSTDPNDSDDLEAWAGGLGPFDVAPGVSQEHVSDDARFYTRSYAGDISTDSLLSITALPRVTSYIDSGSVNLCPVYIITGHRVTTGDFSSAYAAAAAASKYKVDKTKRTVGGSTPPAPPPSAYFRSMSRVRPVAYHSVRRAAAPSLSPLPSPGITDQSESSPLIPVYPPEVAMGPKPEKETEMVPETRSGTVADGRSGSSTRTRKRPHKSSSSSTADEPDRPPRGTVFAYQVHMIREYPVETESDEEGVTYGPGERFFVFEKNGGVPIVDYKKVGIRELRDDVESKRDEEVVYVSSTIGRERYISFKPPCYSGDYRYASGVR